MSEKYLHGRKRRRKRESLGVAVASGLLPWKGDTVADVIRKIVFLVSMIVLVTASIVIIKFYFGRHAEDNYAGYHNINMYNDNTATVTFYNGMVSGKGISNPAVSSDEGYEVEILERYHELLKINPETIGYILIDPYIDYPVVQSQGDKENDYYLKRNFYDRPTENGTIFADKYGAFTPDSRPHNILLHGHNLRTKNQFQPLMNYRDSMRTNGWDFLRANPIIRFDTLYEPGFYKIFAVYQTNVDSVYGDYFDYWRRPYFYNEDDFYAYVVEALDRSHYHTGIDLRYGDELLTLSTCDEAFLDNLRLVIVARRVRISESLEMDLDAFVNNRENSGRTADRLMRYKMFDGFYKSLNSGRGWAGRSWPLSWVEGLTQEWLDNYDKRSEG